MNLLPPLPIDEVLPQVVAALRQQSALVLRAETGAGKTTRVPPALLDAGFAGEGQIVVLQPRRLAARAAATRIAYERNSPLGQEVGYQVRFERRASRATRLLVVTEGVFVRRLHDDPFLEGTNVVVFDEFHERSLDADLALAMTRRVQREVRSELKIVVMSATLEAGPIAGYLDNCPVIESRGRLFPVEVRYLPHERPPGIAESVVAGLTEALSETTGDVLAFLPGLAEIHRTRRALEARERPGVTVMELHGDMPLERQQAVLAPLKSRKVILATNVAETSVTIEGVTAVVDSGLARVLRMDPALGINRLVTERISRASADQRAGRAGRTQSGVCLRLWTRRQHDALPERQTPEILRSDLAGPVLDLLCWGEPDVKAFPWFEPPLAEHVEHALRLLRQLDAIDGSGPTAIGRQLVKLPIHPRLARLLVEGHALGHPHEAVLAAALLSERDPFRQAGAPPNSRPTRPMHHCESDVVDRVGQLIEFEQSSQHRPSAGSINPSAARFVLAARDQLARIVAKEFGAAAAAKMSWQEAIRRGLFVAFFDRLARRRANDATRGVMLGGRGVRLAHESAVREGELFVCVELQETGQTEALVRQASAALRSWLDESRTTTAVDLAFDSSRQRVVAYRRTRIDDLVLDESPAAIPPDADPGAILAREVADPIELLDEEASRLTARVEFLRQAMPELNLPPMTVAALRDLLPHACAGCASVDDVKKRGFMTAIKNQLLFEQQRALDQHAPERIEVPSGSQIAVTYTAGQAPILAVRIQEMFGVAETPKLAAGRVPVVLHLLGPNYRPQQVTTDLASFWRNGYPEVRKELRRRYPKHAWPDDPAHAAPERRPRRSQKG